RRAAPGALGARARGRGAPRRTRDPRRPAARRAAEEPRRPPDRDGGRGRGQCDRRREHPSRVASRVGVVPRLRRGPGTGHRRVSHSGDPVARVVAIDGPSGSGKSTIARGVACALGLPVLDTGAMYRAVAVAALESGTPLDDEDSCARLAREHEIAVDGGITTIDGRDVSTEIRAPEATAAVSVVAAHPGVRTVLV